MLYSLIYINYCADCGAAADKAARKLVLKGFNKTFSLSLVKDRGKWDEKELEGSAKKGRGMGREKEMRGGWR